MGLRVLAIQVVMLVFVGMAVIAVMMFMFVCMTIVAMMMRVLIRVPVVTVMVLVLVGMAVVAVMMRMLVGVLLTGKRGCRAEAQGKGHYGSEECFVSGACHVCSVLRLESEGRRSLISLAAPEGMSTSGAGVNYSSFSLNFPVRGPSSLLCLHPGRNRQRRTGVRHTCGG